MARTTHHILILAYPHKYVGRKAKGKYVRQGLSVCVCTINEAHAIDESV